MGKRGVGYGSEDHLLRYIETEGETVSNAVAAAAKLEPGQIEWVAAPVNESGVQKEFQGIRFLDARERDRLAVAWREFWPQTGKQPSWDAIGRSGDTWLLVEAKANHPEFSTPPSGATREASKRQIEKSLNLVKKRLGVHRFFPWAGNYYQYTNRLASLWFLREQGVDARLVFIYFTGDAFPDGTACPETRTDWEALLEARRLTLGLPLEHKLSAFEHEVYLPALQ